MTPRRPRRTCRGGRSGRRSRNTIDDDDLTVYLILDEAHRGFDTRTHVGQADDRAPAGQRPRWPPADPDRVGHLGDDRALQGGDGGGGRRRQPSRVAGDPGRPVRVQESGLVKDTIVLDIPNEAGNFDTVLVRRAAEKLRDSSAAVGAVREGAGQLPDVVKPLLVLQAPNTPDPDQIGRALDEILRVFPELTGDSVRHVFGDHTVQKFGTWEVEWIEPQRVEDDDERARARREGRNLDRVGLPARGGARVVPAGEETRRTSRSCSAGWSATRSRGAFRATNG